MRSEVSIIYKKSENKQQYSQQLPEIILEADKTEAKKFEHRVVEQKPSDWDLATTKISDDWADNSSTLISNSLTSIEQLEQEQQELESLKSEFSLNSNELVDENKVEREQAGFILETNTPNSQVDNTNSRKENSDTITPTLVTSSSNNSKESGKAWIIGGTVGFFIFLGLMIHGNRANQLISNTEQEDFDTISSETFKQDNIPKTEDILESSPEVSTRLQEQNFNSYDFPLDSCGDKDPGGTNIWYRVYIDDTPENLNTIHSNYCRDAIRKYRQNEQINSIQVAAFTDESKAEADERKSTQDKQVEHTASVVDISMAVEPEINLSKQREDSQVIKTNQSEKNSDVTPINPPSNNSKQSGTAWIIGGVIGFFIFLGLIINGHQVNQTASNKEAKQSLFYRCWL